jgi:hypothetical protein
MSRKIICACNNKKYLLLNIYHSKSKAVSKVVNGVVYIDIQFTASLYTHTNPTPNRGLFTYKPIALPQLTDKSQPHPCSIHVQIQSLPRVDTQKCQSLTLACTHRHTCTFIEYFLFCLFILATLIWASLGPSIFIRSQDANMKATEK